MRVAELGPERLRLLAVRVPETRLIVPFDSVKTFPKATSPLTLTTPPFLMAFDPCHWNESPVMRSSVVFLTSKSVALKVLVLERDAPSREMRLEMASPSP